MLFGQSHILALGMSFLQLGNSGLPGEKGNYKGFRLHNTAIEKRLLEKKFTVQGMWTPSQLLFILFTPH